MKSKFKIRILNNKTSSNFMLLIKMLIKLILKRKLN